MIQFDYIFQMGWFNHQLGVVCLGGSVFRGEFWNLNPHPGGWALQDLGYVVRITPIYKPMEVGHWKGNVAEIP